jgi:Flp pilus assembly protein TadG
MCRKFLRRLRRDDRGGIMIFVGLGLSAMVGVGGLATETLLIYGIKDRLQQSLDAAALAAGQMSEESAMAGEAEDVFMTNFFASGPEAALKSPGLNVAISNGGEQVALSAVAEYQTRFLGVVGFDQIDISGRAVVQREVRPTEVAFVLDVTGSMDSSSKIGALRDAGVILVDILFGDVVEHPNLFVSVVPYTSMVNIGNANEDWLVGYDADAFAADVDGWRGCVMARTGGGDVTDDPPADQPFVPMLSPTDIDNVYPPVNSAQSAKNNGTGPNLGCGPAILPLTNVKATVRDKILDLKAWYRGGTASNLGMAWGWRTISPRWQGLWGLADRPLAYDATKSRKAVVILTDGENQFWPNLTSSGKGVSPGGSDFTGHGRLADLSAETGGTVQTLKDGITELNARFTEICDSLKAEGVDVFTITFGLNSSSQAATREVFRQCATKPDFYFNSPAASDLEQVFRQVGTKLSSLRIVE